MYGLLARKVRCEGTEQERLWFEQFDQGYSSQHWRLGSSKRAVLKSYIAHMKCGQSQNSM